MLRAVTAGDAASKACSPSERCFIVCGEATASRLARCAASSADEPLGDSLTSRSGWLKKKPTSHEKKAWRDAGVQKRFYVSRGLRVEYYDRAPVGEQAGKLKPRGTFDLRNVTRLRPAQPDDPTAP